MQDGLNRFSRVREGGVPLHREGVQLVEVGVHGEHVALQGHRRRRRHRGVCDHHAGAHLHVLDDRCGGIRDVLREAEMAQEELAVHHALQQQPGRGAQHGDQPAVVLRRPGVGDGEGGDVAVAEGRHVTLEHQIVGHIVGADPGGQPENLVVLRGEPILRVGGEVLTTSVELEHMRLLSLLRFQIVGDHVHPTGSSISSTAQMIHKVHRISGHTNSTVLNQT